MVNRCTIVTRLTTADGLVSEVYTGDTDVEQSIIVGIIHDELAPRLLGRSAADPEGAWIAMEPSTNDILRDRGLALQAIACLDEAIWDIFGRALGLPLHRAWGSVTDAVPISIIGGYYHLSLDEVGEMIRRYVEAGFAGMKFKVGGRTPAEDAHRVRVAREAAGPDFVLMVDANQGYDRAQAVEFARLVWDLDVRWFEEPCRWINDARWMRDVRYQTGIPVCAGQSETTLAGIRDLIVGRRHRRLQLRRVLGRRPDDLAQGGRAGRRVRGPAGPPRGAPGRLRTCWRSVPDHTFVECFDEERDPFFWRLTDMSSRIAVGRYTLPERPGFGIELDWDYVRAHTVDARVTDRTTIA